MNIENPIVSVILPVFNGEKFIAKAIESVLAQKKAEFELIVIDDDSTDNTKLVVQKYQKTDNRIKYTLNKYANGPVGKRSPMAARKYGISLSKGKYIAFVDSDDYWCDEYKLKKQVDFLEKNLDYAVVYTDIYSMNESGKIIDDPHFIQTIKKRYTSGYVFFYLLNGSFVTTPTIMLRKEIIIEKKIDICKDWYIYDYWLWLKIALNHKIYFQNEKMVNYRIHSSSLTQIRSFHSSRNQLVLYDIIKEYYSNYYKRSILTKNEKETLSQSLYSLAIGKTLDLRAKMWVCSKFLANMEAYYLIKKKILRKLRL